MHLFIFILPLGFDTLGVSLSLGMKSAPLPMAAQGKRGRAVPLWLRSAILFALAEMLMPIIGLFIGYTLSNIISGIMHYIGVFLLMGLGAWELLEEGREYLRKRKKRLGNVSQWMPAAEEKKAPERFRWGQQLLLALSVSLDELAVGFSLGSVTGKTISPFTFCLLIGLQAFLMTLIGLTLGRVISKRLRLLKEGSELLSAVLLIGLGVWLFFS